MQVFAQKQDTLYAKRVFLSTHIYDDSVKLSNRKVTELFKDTWAPKIKYKWSKALKPVGALVAMGGIGLTSYAIKGTSFITTIEGKQINYRMISLTQLSVGVGMFVIGCSVIASSNQLARHSVDIYNSMLKASQKTNAINKIQFGLTESNAIGFSVLLK
ncbi:hypothetical protein GCM10011514_34960 [Emticicia aquatilis]|uniref:Uncharacterized protein n=2 Tax=Emticicia aquatilis TaxID=1537369 RepID=A0A916YYN6_9BACT|nr:hypothetical protein GCM10011514_34960 [Emticicia aquatilis]